MCVIGIETQKGYDVKKRKASAPSVMQELLGGGNMVIGKANGGEELPDIVADLGVAFHSPTSPPETNKHPTIQSITSFHFPSSEKKKKKRRRRRSRD